MVIVALSKEKLSIRGNVISLLGTVRKLFKLTCESSLENIASNANIFGAATPTFRSSGAAAAAVSHRLTCFLRLSMENVWVPLVKGPSPEAPTRSITFTCNKEERCYLQQIMILQAQYEHLKQSLQKQNTVIFICFELKFKATAHTQYTLHIFFVCLSTGNRKVKSIRLERDLELSLGTKKTTPFPHPCTSKLPFHHSPIPVLFLANNECISRFMSLGDKFHSALGSVRLTWSSRRCRQLGKLFCAIRVCDA